MTDHRMDGWARRLARSDEDLILHSVDGRRSTGGAALDGVSRALAAPITRRRAVGVIGGAVVAGSLLRPGRARAGENCFPGGPKICATGDGKRVCVPNELQCCSNDNCAIACPYSWRDCTAPARCDDTPRQCFDNTNPQRSDAQIKWCSKTVTVVNGCVDGGQSQAVRGWCCRVGETCGTEIGDCFCSSNVSCGNYCCKRGEICVERTFSSNYCDKPCPGGKPKCGGDCCGHTEICGTFGCDCPSGTVRCGGGACCSPNDDPGDPKPFENPFKNMFDMMGQSSSSHGAGNRLVVGRRSQTGAAALDAGLDALAAVNGQGAAAMLAFRNGKQDPAFRRRVVVKRAKPPTLVAGPGLDAASAAALNKLLVAEARANALVSASATALWRARTAHRKKNKGAAKSQLRASAKFAGQAATALKALPSLRTAAANALTAGKVAEVIAKEEAVTAFVDSVRRSGLPSSLRGPLVRLGASSADLKRLRTGVLGLSTVSASGPVLTKPLTDADRAKLAKQLVKELSAFSRRARRHRIAR